MNIIEKVARAIAKANEDDYHWKGYNVFAKAAIKAMQDLDEELIDYGHLYASTSSQTVKEVWEGIFNKVLKED